MVVWYKGGSVKIATIRIPCKDLKKSEGFYTEKLGLNKIFGDAESGFIGYQLENTQLLLELEEIGEFEAGRYLGFSVEIDDIQGFYESKSQSGVTFVGAPEKQEWGGIMTHVEDVSGNSFSIIQKVH